MKKNFYLRILFLVTLNFAPIIQSTPSKSTSKNLPVQKRFAKNTNPASNTAPVIQENSARETTSTLREKEANQRTVNRKKLNELLKKMTEEYFEKHLFEAGIIMKEIYDLFGFKPNNSHYCIQTALQFYAFAKDKSAEFKKNIINIIDVNDLTESDCIAIFKNNPEGVPVETLQQLFESKISSYYFLKVLYDISSLARQKLEIVKTDNSSKTKDFKSHWELVAGSVAKTYQILEIPEDTLSPTNKDILEQFPSSFKEQPSAAIARTAEDKPGISKQTSYTTQAPRQQETINREKLNDSLKKVTEESFNENINAASKTSSDIYAYFDLTKDTSIDRFLPRSILIYNYGRNKSPQIKKDIINIIGSNTFTESDFIAMFKNNPEGLSKEASMQLLETKISSYYFFKALYDISSLAHATLEMLKKDNPSAVQDVKKKWELIAQSVIKTSQTLNMPIDKLSPNDKIMLEKFPSPFKQSSTIQTFIPRNKAVRQKASQKPPVTTRKKIEPIINRPQTIEIQNSSDNIVYVSQGQLYKKNNDGTYTPITTKEAVGARRLGLQKPFTIT